jgi:hypothetical protein
VLQLASTGMTVSAIPIAEKRALSSGTPVVKSLIETVMVPSAGAMETDERARGSRRQSRDVHSSAFKFDTEAPQARGDQIGHNSSFGTV